MEQGPLQEVRGLVPMALSPRTRRSKVQDLTLTEVSVAIEVLEDLPGAGNPVGRGAVQVEIGPQDVPEHQVVVGGHHRLRPLSNGVTAQGHQIP